MAFAYVPLPRIFQWQMVSPELREDAMRLLADAEGLDGYAAAYAVAHACAHPESPWIQSVDVAFQTALGGYITRPIVALGEALARAIGPGLEHIQRHFTGLAVTFPPRRPAER